MTWPRTQPSPLPASLRIRSAEYSTRGQPLIKGILAGNERLRFVMGECSLGLGWLDRLDESCVVFEAWVRAFRSGETGILNHLADFGFR